MDLVVFENLFNNEKQVIRTKFMDAIFLDITKVEEFNSEKYFHFMNSHRPKVLFLNTTNYSRQLALSFFPEGHFLYYFSSYFKEYNRLYLPRLMIKQMAKLKNLKSFNFFQLNSHAKYHFIEGKILKNPSIIRLFAVFCFWLVCVGVAFFWETNNFESNHLK